MVWLFEVVYNVDGELVSHAGSVMVHSDVQLTCCAFNILFSAFGAC